MDPNSPTYGEAQLVPLNEHETAVEHYEKLCNQQLDKIHFLEKQVQSAHLRIKKLESELAMSKQMFNGSRNAF